MEMFGGLTRTSSRIAIAAAFGLALGGYALSAGPATAADFGGDCCADLEERVAELEATTVRKGNRKVSVTLSGWVVKSFNWWDDGSVSSVAIGDKDYDLGTRFALTGSATISPGWSAGYNITVLAPSSVFGFGANQFDEFAGTYGAISTLYSYMYVKSDHWGTLNWGHLSPASDNPAVLADISGTVIESNAVFFEGPGFFIKGGVQPFGLVWGDFLTCTTLGAGIGADCFGAAQPAIRYDSPTWGGFRFETSYGKNQLVPAPGGTTDSNFWDIAAFYTGDWGDWKVSGAYAFTWLEENVFGSEAKLHQVGATVMHTPSGLGLYGLGQWEDASGFASTEVWYLKPFWKKTWSPMGATVFFGEYGQYKDMHAGAQGALAAQDFTLIGGTKVERWGLGVVQEIDAAAMHLFLRWQSQSLDRITIEDDLTGDRARFGASDWNLIQAGGVIFF
jgi:hypothetical protein